MVRLVEKEQSCPTGGKSHSNPAASKATASKAAGSEGSEMVVDKSEPKATSKKAASKKAVSKKDASKKAASKKKQPGTSKKTSGTKKAAQSGRSARRTTKLAPSAFDAYVLILEPRLKELAQELRHLVHEVIPEAREAIKWGQPCWQYKGNLCYLTGARQNLTFGFFLGSKIDDPKGLLEGKGRQMRHIKLEKASDIPEAAVRSWLKQAARLNDRHGFPT